MVKRVWPTEFVWGVVSILSDTDEWSEFKSKMLFTEQYKLLRIFMTKMSKISGFFQETLDQMVRVFGIF